VISDHQMPKTKGAEFLAQLRNVYPGIVRILTTAYSELDAAIDAVNHGAIYQYVKKPWDLQELSEILKRATDLYVIQQERDLLLRGKLSVIQRMIITNRVHSLAMMAMGLGIHINNPLAALTAFMDHLSKEIQEDWTNLESEKSQEPWHDLSNLAVNECKAIREIGKKILTTIKEFNSNEHRKASIEYLVQSGVETFQELTKADKSEIRIEHKTNIQELFVDPKMIKHCFRLLMEIMTTLWEAKNNIFIETNEATMNGKTGIRTVITAQGQIWKKSKIKPLHFILRQNNDIEVSLNFLISCFMIHHHSGNIVINKDIQKYPCIDVFIPLNCKKEPNSNMQEDYMEKLHRYFDIWDVALL